MDHRAASRQQRGGSAAQAMQGCDHEGLGPLALLLAGSIYVTNFPVPQVREYQTPDGRSPFGEWFWRLERRAAARVTRAIERLEGGGRPDVHSVGGGVQEARIHYGPGYRVYFGIDGDLLIVLLAGGEKKSQEDDIAAAQRRWTDYRARKREDVRHGAYT